MAALIEAKHLAYLVNFEPNRNNLKHVLVQKGNLKIPSSTAIFNMSSATECPSKKLKLCKAIVNEKCLCYAKRSERPNRPRVLPFRRKQKKYWLSVTPERFCLEFLALSLKKKKPFNAIRFNEAGDFHSQDCVNKAEKIARILKKFGVICYLYTSRNDLDYSHVKALKISGSGFKKKGIVNIFKIISSKKNKPKGYGLCKMDCRICNRCLRSGLKTAVIKH